MRVIERALETSKFKNINNIITSTDFPWYYNDSSVDDDKISYMSHLFVKFGKPNSDFFYLIEDVLKILKPIELLHIRANLTINKNKVCKTPWHNDFHKADPRHRTAILYLNTNNGYTEFRKPRKMIKSKANRLIEFEGHMSHRAVTQTDQDRRIVINFNYFI